MSEAIDRVLERVARAIVDDDVRAPSAIVKVLERELKLLLEALRDAVKLLDVVDEHIDVHNCSGCARLEDKIAAFNRTAALASRERPAERGKGNE